MFYRTIILTLVIVSLNLVAKEQKIDNTKESNSSTKKEILDKYKKALIYYKNKEYEKSYQLFTELFNKNLNDVNINFYLGRISFELRKYQEALVAYERVLFQKPESIRTKYEMARAYFILNEFKESKRLFDEVKKAEALPDHVKISVEKYLEIIDTKVKKHSIGGLLMVGAIYDSNYGSQNEDNYLEYLPQFDTANVSDESTIFHQEVALLNYKYRYSDNKNIKFDFVVLNKQSSYTEYGDRDIQFVSLSPIFSILHTDKLSVDYGLYFDYLRYGYIPTLQTFAFLPKINYKHNKDTSISGYLKYQSKTNLIDSYTKNDSKYIELSASISHKYSKKITFTPSLTFINEKAEDSSATGVDYSAIKLAISSNYIYTPSIYFTPSLTYTYSKYDDLDSVKEIKEERENTKIAISAIKVFSPKWILNSSIDYTVQSSNIVKNEYDKYTMGIHIIRPF